MHALWSSLVAFWNAHALLLMPLYIVAWASVFATAAALTAKKYPRLSAFFHVMAVFPAPKKLADLEADGLAALKKSMAAATAIVGMIGILVGGTYGALQMQGCAAFTSGVKTAVPIVHDVNQIAEALCASYEATATGSPIDSPKVVKFCSLYENYAPFIATVTAKQQEARAGVALKTAALPDRCAQPGAAAKGAAPASDAGASTQMKMPTAQPAPKGK